MSGIDLLATLAMAIGVFFVTVAAVGFIRLPDVFCRLHVTGVIDTLGAPMIMIGAAIHLGGEFISFKLMMGVVFLVLTSPLLGHLLARAALEAGQKPAGVKDLGGSEESAPERSDR